MENNLNFITEKWFSEELKEANKCPEAVAYGEELRTEAEAVLRLVELGYTEEQIEEILDLASKLKTKSIKQAYMLMPDSFFNTPQEQNPQSENKQKD